MFKVGDKVECISMSDFPATQYLPTADHRSGGAGYKEGFVFVIKNITHSIPFDILWGGVYDGGVYSFAVKPFAEYGGILTKEEIGIIEKLNKS